MTDESASSVHHVIIRKSHPALYRSIMTIGVAGVLLALNLFFYTPTFRPLGIPFEAVGSAFLLIGTSLIVFLNLFHRLGLVRITLAISIAFMLFWGGINTIQVFDGRASFQLPILMLTLAAIQAPWLIESPINPMTEKR